MGVRPGQKGHHLNRLTGIETFFFDLDGCIWFGDELAAGAPELVSSLRNSGRRVAFVSNITSATTLDVAQKLERLGIPAAESDVLTPFAILRKHPLLAGSGKVFLLGNALMHRAVADLGVQLTGGPEEADVVVVSRDPELTYGQLAEAARALDAGAKLLALNLDARVPVEGGVYLPGNGAIVAALTTATGVEAEALGKPSRFFFEQALERFGAERQATAMVGDNLDSDIAGGNAAGLLTIHVGGALFSNEEVPPVPDYSVADLQELAELLTESAAVST